MLTQGTARSPGPYGGMLPPIPISTAGVFPYGYVGDALTFSMTANRVYYVPYPVFRPTTYSGLQFRDNGAGNNGINIRVAVCAEANTGGPGAVLKDFGATGLTGVAGIHKAASAVTIPGPQMCYLAMVSDGTPSMLTMGLYQLLTAVGQESGRDLPSLLGDIGGINLQAIGINTPVIGWYAAMAYGAFGASATTPTANIIGANSASTGTLPAMQLYI